MGKLVLFLALLGLVGAAAPATAQPGRVWSATWGASPQAPTDLLGPSWAVGGFENQTVRQVVRVSRGGAVARVRFSNLAGTAPLRITGATVARSTGGAAVASVRQLTFGGRTEAVVPAGRDLASDPVVLPVEPLGKVAVTLYFAGKSGPATGHGFANATSYRASGDHRADPSATAFTDTSQSWYYLSGVEVLDLPPRRNTVVAFGDSITEGAYSTVDGDNRYPDQLAERGRGRFGVVNAGIGGNRLLSGSPCFGEPGVDRFARDVLAQPDVRTVVVLEGVNDIGASAWANECFPAGRPVTAADLIAGHRKLIAAARAKGVRIVGATVLPFKGAMYFTEEGEAVRDALNTWIRTSGEYDAVVDFDRVTADPADPDALRPAYDCGDRLHPNDAGYQAMADAVDLSAL
ncbi:SGNH/GDSL hydrolase family protein [Actinosynnema sp. NPDC020468]|uniref:SGNH/GDSL hydrolase family protein n=1 Tax=Actinosynnema sp. NPDC020468 TaxID=3154488 RepID=UPI003410DEC2